MKHRFHQDLAGWKFDSGFTSRHKDCFMKRTLTSHKPNLSHTNWSKPLLDSTQLKILTCVENKLLFHNIVEKWQPPNWETFNKRAVFWFKVLKVFTQIYLRKHWGNKFKSCNTNNKCKLIKGFHSPCKLFPIPALNETSKQPNYRKIPSESKSISYFNVLVSPVLNFQMMPAA